MVEFLKAVFALVAFVVVALFVGILIAAALGIPEATSAVAQAVDTTEKVVSTADAWLQSAAKENIASVWRIATTGK